jgi:hypothetical protein
LLFEDDGESWGYQNGNALWLEWEMACDATTVNLKIARRGLSSGVEGAEGVVTGGRRT